MSTPDAITRFKDLTSNVDDLSEFVTEVMRYFDVLKASGQRSEIEIGLENWLRPDR